jgi:hypothetical protein
LAYFAKRRRDVFSQHDKLLLQLIDHRLGRPALVEGNSRVLDALSFIAPAEGSNSADGEGKLSDLLLATIPWASSKSANFSKLSSTTNLPRRSA